jgi:hypothetical protein
MDNRSKNNGLICFGVYLEPIIIPGPPIPEPPDADPSPSPGAGEIAVR